MRKDQRPDLTSTSLISSKGALCHANLRSENVLIQA